MARKRMLSPDTWSDPVLGVLTFRQRLLYIALKNFSDDEGRFRNHPALIKSFAFPFDSEVSLDDVAGDVAILVARRLLQAWKIEGQDYAQIAGWHSEQKIQYPTASKIPPDPADTARPEFTAGTASPQPADAARLELIPVGFIEPSVNSTGGLNEDSRTSQSKSSSAQISSEKSSGQSVTADDSTGQNPDRGYWTLHDDDLGGFQAKEVREAYSRLTGNQSTKSDRDQIELTGADYQFSSRALVAVMEIIAARSAGKHIRSFAYFRAGITEVWKRCIDAEENAARMSVGSSAEKRQEIFRHAVRREVTYWSRRGAA